MLQARDLLKDLLSRCKVLLNSLHDWSKHILVEVDNPIEVQLWAEKVEKDILTIALVDL